VRDDTNMVYSLAYCEVYIMAALMAVEDISYDHDLIVLQTKNGSISVRIAIE
jgi:hypothetical protein